MTRLRRQSRLALLSAFLVALVTHPAVSVAQSDADLIAEITAPLPEHLRADATVRDRAADGALFHILSGPDRNQVKLLVGVFLPDATAASTGLSTERSDGTWLMCPGTRRAHIMMGDIPYGQDEGYHQMCGR